MIKDTVANFRLVGEKESGKKHAYSSPQLIIYGDMKRVTKKDPGIQDHNQSNNGMGFIPGKGPPS